MTGALSTRSLLDEGVVRIRADFPKVFLPLALPMAFLRALLILVQQPRTIAEWSAFVVTFLAVLAAMVLTSTVMQVLALDTVYGRPRTVRSAFAWMLKPTVWLTLVLQWFILIVGTLLCILPGLYGMLVLALVVPVMLRDEVFGASALRTSVDMMSFNPAGRFREDPRVKMTAVVAATWLLSATAGLLLQLPMIVASMWVAFRSVAEGGGSVDPVALTERLRWIQLPSAFFGSFVETAMGLYFVSWGAQRLADLRRRQSGDDIASELDALVREPDVAPTP